MEILNYKVFKTNEEFVEWQKQALRKLSSVIPLASGIEGSVDGDNQNGSANFTTSLSVFVTYFEQSE